MLSNGMAVVRSVSVSVHLPNCTGGHGSQGSVTQHVPYVAPLLNGAGVVVGLKEFFMLKFIPLKAFSARHNTGITWSKNIALAMEGARGRCLGWQNAPTGSPPNLLMHEISIEK